MEEMEQHDLKQKDLIEIGSPCVVSEILSRKRELNKRQINIINVWEVNKHEY